VLEYGDGWLPNDHAEVGNRIAELNRLAAEHGRAPIPVTVYAVPPTVADIERLAAAGAVRCVFNLPRGGSDVTLPTLARFAALITQWR
jgi:hypothetical protein